MSIQRIAIFTSFFLLLIVACSSEESGPTGPPCEQLSKRFCDKARSCAPDPDQQGACRWFYGTGNSLGRNCSVCEGGIIDRLCNDPTKSASQIDRCAAIFDQAACEPSNDGPGARVPTDCGDILLCGGGPCKN